MKSTEKRLNRKDLARRGRNRKEFGKFTAETREDTEFGEDNF